MRWGDSPAEIPNQKGAARGDTQEPLGYQEGRAKAFQKAKVKCDGKKQENGARDTSSGKEYRIAQQGTQ